MLQKVFSSYHQDTVIVGGRNVPQKRSIVQLGDYLNQGDGSAAVASLPVAPPTLSGLDVKATPILRNILLNNLYGCCVPAGCLHVQAVTSANGSGIIEATDADVIALYKQMNPGFDPKDPSTDTGCDEQSAFRTLMTVGFPNGEKLVGFAGVDGTNPTLVRQVMYTFENVIFGVSMPTSWVNPLPEQDGYLWRSDAPNQRNGHCFIGFGYAPGVINIDSWGIYGAIDDMAVASLTTKAAGGELYVLFLSDTIDKASQKSPDGFAYDDLQNALQRLQAV